MKTRPLQKSMPKILYRTIAPPPPILGKKENHFFRMGSNDVYSFFNIILFFLSALVGHWDIIEGSLRAHFKVSC